MSFAIRLNHFTGEIPRKNYRTLPTGASRAAENVFLTSGRIDPMYVPYKVANTNRSSPANTIYRMFSGATDYWLNWNEQVDVARSPIAGDASFKIAFTSASFEPRQTNLALASSATPYPASWYVLGVTPPVTAPTIGTITGGSGSETRAYVYTFVTPWGEESAPSPASAATTGATNGATWPLSGMDIAPPNNGTITAATYAAGQVTVTLNSVFGLRANETITFSGVAGMTDLNSTFRLVSVNAATKQVVVTLTTAQTYTSGGIWTRVSPHNTTGWKQRIYRTVAGGTTYYLVAEQAAAATYSDNVTTIQDALATTGWAMPPADLQGVITLPNGSMAGFSGNQLCLSVPYAPYAWPLAYRYTTDSPIVGISAFGQSVVVGTTGVPYIATGTEPAFVTFEKVPQAWPCLSKRGMISFVGGVMYPTTIGLALIGYGGASIISESLFSQVEWSTYAPSTFIAAHYDGRYYAAYTVGGVTKVLVVSTESGVSTVNIAPTALTVDAANGNMYMTSGNGIYNLTNVGGPRTAASWGSKEFVLPNPVNLGAAQVNAVFYMTADQIAQITAYNATITASNATTFAGMQTNAATATHIGTAAGALNSFQAGSRAVNASSFNTNFLAGAETVTFTLWVNDAPFYSTSITSEKAFRLPSGVKYDNFFFTVTGTAPVQDVVLAETMLGLKQV